jgi:uncharacterized protein DUF4252
MHRRLRLLAIAGLTPLLLSGCLWAPELGQIQREIQSQLPGSQFENEVRLSLGPLSLGLARFVTRFIPENYVPEAGEAHEYLQEVRSVQVAMYRTRTLPSLETVRMPPRLKQIMQEQNWQLTVKNQKTNELTWVLTRVEGGVVRDLYVVLLDREQLVLVRVEGSMNELLAKAMRNRADELPQMLGLDLRSN